MACIHTSWQTRYLYGASTRRRHRNGFDPKGFNREGFGRDGYDALGRDKDGFGRDGRDRWGFDRHGLDNNGRDRRGYDKAGFDRAGRNRRGLDRLGFDRRGFDVEGFNAEGIGRGGADLLPGPKSVVIGEESKVFRLRLDPSGTSYTVGQSVGPYGVTLDRVGANVVRFTYRGRQYLRKLVR